MLAAALVVHLLGSPASPSGQGDVSALRVTVVEDATAGRIELEVTNPSAVPATAWAIDAVGADGRRLGGLTQESYVQLLNAEPKLPVEGHPVRQEVSPMFRDAKLAVAAVVYADGKALGDPARIDEIFARRRATADAWVEILTRFEALARSPVTPQRLRAALIDLDDTGGRADTPAHGMAAARLRLIAASPDPDGRFRAFLATCRRHADLAREHSVRR
jgi:hypothetical protein